MTAGTALAFPGGRTLAGWWRQLAPNRPQALWVGHLLLHHVEALARLARPRRPDPLQLLLLRAVALEQPSAAPSNHHPAADPLGRLEARLHLGRQAVLGALRSLSSTGLLQGGPEGPWGVSALGQQALQEGEYPHFTYERLPFHFVERGPTERPRSAFLALRTHATIPWPAGADWAFDVADLRACVARPRDWKEHCGFPPEVDSILTPEVPPDELPEAPSWVRVVVDRPERLPVAVVAVRAEDGSERLLGFSVKQEGWALTTTEPAFVLRGEGVGALSGLLEAPPTAAWREAWRQWCGPRSLPENEVAACAVEREGARAQVRAPARLIERLRSTRSDALKGEAWLLAGEGPFRAAAVVELVEAQ